MDKTAIKNFAIAARKMLINSAIEQAGFYGITRDNISNPVQKGADFEVYETISGAENRIFGSDINRRNNLVKAINELGFDQVMEETAYTWFNRIIAIRFMEVNNYLPSRIRVLSSETSSDTPDIISQYQTIELNLTSAEIKKIQEAKITNNYDEAFRLLFIKQCNELNKILPGLFNKIDDYMELLLKLPYTSDGVVRLLVDSVAEDNFNVETEGQVEIIGWMYQYYNSELKDDTFAKLKKNIKITKERIPAATQLFTPDWIVRYMVENSVGRVWIDHLRAVDSSVDEKAKAEEYGWKYYLPEAEQDAEVAKELVEVRKSNKDIMPQDITCIDPCMGSGHILVYMFDVLMDIYKSEGYSERDAVFDILEKNIFGLDIDRRAYQLSYFAMMMKGRGYGGRRFFRGKEDENGELIPVAPHVYAIEESNSIGRDQLKYYGAGLDELSKNSAITQMNGLLDTLTDAKEYGSILNVENYDWKLLRQFVAEVDTDGQMTFDSMRAVASQKLILRLVDIGEVLAKKYDAVVTNPPYMGGSSMGNKLVEYARNEYPDSKLDLFAIFIEKCKKLTKNKGVFAMITQNSWMFLSSYEELRRKLSGNATMNMVHLGARAFDEIAGEVVQTTTFSIRKIAIPKYEGVYIRVTSSIGERAKEEAYLDGKTKKNAGVYFENSFVNYERIPGMPIAYWVSEKLLLAFENGTLLDFIAHPKKGLATTDNNRFLRAWFEVDMTKTGYLCLTREEAQESKKKWFPLNKGGEYRKWYGNKEYLVNWYNDGKEMKDAIIKRYNGGSYTKEIRSESRYFSESITWSALTTGIPSFRYSSGGALFDSAGSSMFPERNKFYILALLNSKIVNEILHIINPTLNYGAGSLAKLPILEKSSDEIEIMARQSVDISKEDWNSFEISWDYEEHPFTRLSKGLWDSTAVGASMHYYYGGHLKVSCPVELCFMLWQGECNERFKKLKENEEELNRIFIDIYGLQDELTPEVEDKDITVRKADLGRDIRSLISYAVGCMFGRYSLAKSGLVYAGGKFDDSQYGDFQADDDAIIPITDEAYFNDDIVGRFEEFIKLVFGADSLEANLKYIADALGTKGATPREKIRTYFLNDFFKDHCNTYSVTGSGKRPIYWLFDSGKQNGFKALIYMHRYTPDTVGLVRSVYLKKASDAIEASLKNAEYIISENASAVDVAQATKKRDKYVKQLAEIKPYYQALSHVAMQRIPLDLDDGVKVNYAKFQGIEVAEDGGKRLAIDLLAKI